MLNFNAGLSALRSSQLSMDVIGNNIANANTPGYHRQTVHQVEALPLFDGNFWRGTGVEISRINQIASLSVESALTTNIADVHSVQQSRQVARQIETSLSSSSGSMHHRFQEFFDEFHLLQSQPDSVTQRRVVANTSQTLANEFNSVAAGLNQLQVATRQQIQQELDVVNQRLQSLSQLNQQIAAAQAQGQQPNSLLDTHQQLVNQIAESIDITVIPESQGFTYQFAQNRVSITQSTFSLEAQFNTDGSVAFAEADGGFAIEFGGGRLAGLQHSLNDVIPGYRQQLDELASSFIQAVDHVQATGVNQSGPFDLLTTGRPVSSTSIPLADADLPFDIQQGELFVSVYDTATGERSQHRIAIDPTTQSLDDLSKEFNQIPRLQAVVNTTTNAMTIVAGPGYGFDFGSQLPTGPPTAGITGDAEIDFHGVYSEMENRDLNFVVQGTGQVGVADNLSLLVTDQLGNAIGEFELGKGYEPGSRIDLGDGVEISIDSGTLNDGDSFSVTAVADSDTARVLTALSLNSFFNGSQANDIQVSSQIADNSLLISAGRTSAAGDGSNAARILGLREQSLVAGESSFEDYLARTTSTIAIEVDGLNALQTDLEAFHNTLQREREAISGVDPNEEMVHMLKFQRSFQAAVRVITTIDQTLAELMNIIR